MTKLPGLEASILQTPKIAEAFDFAKQLHGEVPYGKEGNMFDNQINRTARILLDGINKAGEVSPQDQATLIIIALLHKSFELGKTNAGKKMGKEEKAAKEEEYSRTSVDEIKAKFGDRVADVLVELRDMEKGERGAAKRARQEEGAPKLSEFAAAVMLAEKAANIETSVHNPTQSKDDKWHAKYIKEALKVANELPRETELTKMLYNQVLDTYRHAARTAPGFRKSNNDPRAMSENDYKAGKARPNQVS